MKQLLVFLFSMMFSVAAFAQFPLGSDENGIRAYFDKNIPYISAQDFTTQDSIKAVCFTKVKEVGDYTFYFDNAGICFSYTVTYDNKEMTDLVRRFNNQFVKIYATRWTAPDNSFVVTLVPPNPGENYFSIVYKPLDPSERIEDGGVMASNQTAAPRR